MDIFSRFYIRYITDFARQFHGFPTVTVTMEGIWGYPKNVT